MPELVNRDAIERRIARLLGRTLKEQETAVNSAVGRSGGASDTLDIDWGALGVSMAVVLRPALESIYLNSAQAFMESQPIGVDWGLINERAAAWAERNAAQLVQGITETTRSGVQRKLAAGIREGLTQTEINKSLQNIFSPVRAELISTTEVTRAAVEGELQFAEELRAMGVETIPVWETALVDVCPICEPRDGKVRGDGWDDPPPAHPRCRCWLNHVNVEA